MSTKMNPRRFALLLISSTLLAAGCAYRGAAYSEFTTAGIDLRADATSGAPVRFIFGYDRGVGAYVPRRNSGTTDSQGEAVSVVSWSYLRTTPAPTPQNANNTAISVDAGFISGTAAQVIAAPKDFDVIIIEPTVPGASTTPSVTATPNVTGFFTTQGAPGDRIAIASAVDTFIATTQREAQAILDFVTLPNGELDRLRLNSLAKGTSLQEEIQELPRSFDLAQLKMNLQERGVWFLNIHDLFENIPTR